MEINGVSTASSNATSGDRGVNSLGSEDFYKILVAEMQNQDPFEPNDTSDIISQVSQIRTIEQSSTLNDTLAQFASQQKTTGAGDLIGKYVQAIVGDANGEQQLYEGVVTGASFATDGTAMLELDNGLTVRAVDIVRILPVNENPYSMLASDTAEDAALEAAAAAASDDDKAASVASSKDDSWLNLEGSVQL